MMFTCANTKMIGPDRPEALMALTAFATGARMNGVCGFLTLDMSAKHQKATGLKVEPAQLVQWW